jgi:hypothetical protein
VSHSGMEPDPKVSANGRRWRPETAEGLTVEMAARSGTDRGVNPSTLPKIEGKPSGG